LDTDTPENIDPAVLALSEKLLTKLIDWAETYNRTRYHQTGEAKFKSREEV